jgi:hypothetical protein
VDGLKKLKKESVQEVGTGRKLEKNVAGEGESAERVCAQEKTITQRVEAKRKRPRKMESQEGWGGEATGSNDTRKQGEQGTKNSGEGARGGYERTEVQQGKGEGAFLGGGTRKIKTIGLG